MNNAIMQTCKTSQRRLLGGMDGEMLGIKFTIQKLQNILQTNARKVYILGALGPPACLDITI